MEDRNAAPMKSCHSVTHMYLVVIYFIHVVGEGGGGEEEHCYGAHLNEDAVVHVLKIGARK